MSFHLFRYIFDLYQNYLDFYEITAHYAEGYLIKDLNIKGHLLQKDTQIYLKYINLATFIIYYHPQYCTDGFRLITKEEKIEYLLSDEEYGYDASEDEINEAIKNGEGKIDTRIESIFDIKNLRTITIDVDIF